MKELLEEKYKVLSEREHILLRSGRYIGSTKTEIESSFVIEDSKAVLKDVKVNKGILKLFDEIVSNSVDEHKRNPQKLNHIKISINTQENYIKVWDNGGIPVRTHLELSDVWIPTLIFSSMRTGTNFDDTEERTGAGTHGEGSVLVNIFSNRFLIETCDGILKFKQEFSNNMEIFTEPEISNSRRHHTCITFYPDLERFGLMSLNEILHTLVLRTNEISATNESIKVELIVDDNSISVVKDFKAFSNLFFDEIALHEKMRNCNLVVASSNSGFTQLSYVNSVRTFDGGTHVDLISGVLIEEIRKFLSKKHKTDVKPADIKNHLFLMIDCVVKNPEWSSQTKEKLISKKDDFLFDIELSPKFIKDICNSEIVASILDWIERKQNAEEQKALRALAKSSPAKVEKLIDAKSKNREECSLYIFEGDSALSAVRKLRDPQKIGAFPLRGKFINVFDMKPSEIADNKEAVSLMNSIGLKIGEKPENLRYSKICLASDADIDGTSICALLVNFFAKYWPNLFKEERVLRILTPLYVAKTKKEKKYFYHQKDFDTWVLTADKKWEIMQKKGLAALEDEEYEKMLNEPVYETLTLDSVYSSSLKSWFGPDSNLRKEKLAK